MLLLKRSTKWNTLSPPALAACIHPKNKMWQKVVCFLLLCAPLWADNIYYEFGPGIANQTQQSYSDVKLGEVGRVHEGKTFVWHYCLGGWEDSSGWPGAKSAGYVAGMIGWEPQVSKTMYLNYSIGPMFLYPTDSVEAGSFQVAQELGFGLKDYRNVRLGFALRHFSDGDAVEPNYGRNFFVIRVQN
jgi:hypothetical protein